MEAINFVRIVTLGCLAWLLVSTYTWLSVTKDMETDFAVAYSRAAANRSASEMAQARHDENIRRDAARDAKLMMIASGIFFSMGVGGLIALSSQKKPPQE